MSKKIQEFIFHHANLIIYLPVPREFQSKPIFISSKEHPIEIYGIYLNKSDARKIIMISVTAFYPRGLGGGGSEQII